MMRQLRESRVNAPGPTIPKAESKRQGYRKEVQAWMKRKQIAKLDDAAKRLALSKSALKSIMSSRGKLRCGADTLGRILKEIRKR